LATPNPYTPLGDDKVVVTNAIPDEAAPAPDPNIPWAPTLGWESFVNSLDANAKRELGVVDEILISYANFAGDAFKTFDVDFARLMDRIIAIEDAMEFDLDEIVQTQTQTRDALSELNKIVLANATGISDIQTLMKANATLMSENISNVAAL
jgi:hypothetical protein